MFVSQSISRHVVCLYLAGVLRRICAVLAAIACTRYVYSVSNAPANRHPHGVGAQQSQVLMWCSDKACCWCWRSCHRHSRPLGVIGLKKSLLFT